MKELHNHIFSATTCISKETMMKYINHQLSKTDLHEVEKHMLDCDLCSDAMSGMKYATNTTTILAIDSKIENRIVNGTSTSFFRGSWLMAAASIIVVIFGTYILINLFDENKFADNEMAVTQQKNEEHNDVAFTENYIQEEKTNEHKNDNLENSTNDANEVNTLGIVESSAEELKQSAPLSVSDKSNYKGTPNKDRLEGGLMDDEVPASLYEEVAVEVVFSKNDKNPSSDNEAMDNLQQVVVSSTLFPEESEVKADKVVVEKQKNENNRKKATFVQAPAMPKHEAVASGNSLSVGKTAQNTYYLLDYKVVDYAVEYQNEEDFKKSAETDATPVDFFNKEQKVEAEKSLEQTVIKETYKEVLERAIVNFKSLAYKEALVDFEIILTKHPKDVNALFYGALSYYNLKDYKKALSKLDAVLKNPQTEFNQETKWNKALTLIELKEISKAKVLLQEIIDEKGFYHQRAQDKLKTLN